MIGKRTRTTFNLLKILMMLSMVVILTTIPVLFFLSEAANNFDPYGPNAEGQAESLTNSICAIICILGLFGLAILGLIIAAGIMMIVSRKEHEEIRVKGIISGIILLSSLLLSVFYLIPLINILVAFILPIIFYGSIILYLHALNSKRGRIILYVAGGIIITSSIISVLNTFMIFFGLFDTYTTTLYIGIMGTQITLQIATMILIIISISTARKNLDYDVGNRIEEGTDIPGSYNRVHGQTQPASSDWLSYDTLDQEGSKEQ